MASRIYASPKRTASAQQTRERLIAAAAGLLKSFNDHEKFSLEAVAKAASVTRLTVYKQFGSRTALLEAAFDAYAVEGGLNKIPQAMSQHDPREGLKALIDIFCDFWVFCERGADRLYAYSLDDPELRDSMHERNERRRRALSVLIGRMVDAKTLRAENANDIVDTLFAFTGYQFYTQLQHGKRTAKDMRTLLHALADRALGLALNSRR